MNLEFDTIEFNSTLSSAVYNKTTDMVSMISFSTLTCKDGKYFVETVAVSSLSQREYPQRMTTLKLSDFAGDSSRQKFEVSQTDMIKAAVRFLRKGLIDAYGFKPTVELDILIATMKSPTYDSVKNYLDALKGST